VQHVESRAEAVRQISGVTIRETLPDTALDGAEFELVDLPPAELRARLKAGKVYLPEAARAALPEIRQHPPGERIVRVLRDYSGQRGDGFSSFSLVTNSLRAG